MPEIKFAEEDQASKTLPDDFEPYVKDWFNEQFPSLSPPQKYSFDLIHNQENSLICAPTGSGKTLSAFLSTINELYRKGREDELEDQVYVLYVSPLRALNNDIQRNLKEPLEGIKQKAEEGDYDVPEVRSAVRTGDTTDAEKANMRENPPHILITTPESLGIILNSPKFGEALKNVEYVITDEIHSLAENKRGVHLNLGIERLEEMANTNPTRIGLSATQAPIKEIAKSLVGYDVDEEITMEEGEYEDIEAAEEKDSEDFETRGCTIVDVAASKEIDLETVSPVRDLIHTPADEVQEAMYDQIHNYVQEHESTIIFTNTRSATERIVNNLKNRFPDFYDENIGAHHSSMSRGVRLEVEEKLKKGEMRVGVTSTSLELGVDIGAVDLVLQLGSPKGVAKGIQRIGRSGHQIGEKAKGKMIVTDRDDAMECSVLTKCAKEDELDRIQMPTNCLDVLAQHMVGMACNKRWNIEHAFNTIRKSYNYRNLSREDFDAVMKYLGGEYEELEDQNVYRKIWIDHEDSRFGRSGKMTRVIYMTNIGTIPDETGYDVKTRQGGNYVGQLDEEFLDRLTKGDIFTLGGKTYQFSYAKGMKVFVDPKPNASPTVPSWYSERLPLSYDLGTRIGEFRSQVKKQLEMGAEDDDIIQWIMHNYYLDEKTAEAIYGYIAEQYRFSGEVSTHEDIKVEKYIDDDNRQNLIFQTIYGRRVHDALARIMAHLLQQKYGSNIGMVIDDNGFILITPRRPVDLDRLMEQVMNCDPEKELKEAVKKTELMKRRFRHVAGRSLMILRNYQGNSKTVGQQQMKGHFLLSAIRNKYDESFPMVKETYREIMEDAMDVNHAEDVIEGLRDGSISYEMGETDIPSPFSHNLLLQGSTDVIKMEDKKERLQQMHQQVLDRIEESN
ncbi:ATP-dependent helicase [Candidatus Nanohalobium constans]|uniref:ATP-dependent helicase Lhr and Lhr-like helicase n=1 Tax=Candidatus Nanohalobium constans TaxID=2565781 RepID=A0A5Q0UH85_9ARCH|nr:ATP-dependent helicase [Candidatus Nanohalobium constans]QGA80269.1 ATP-dependent helicase Lhr and Lhr-like helicase [Candidatus Nanohalobium constans]